MTQRSPTLARWEDLGPLRSRERLIVGCVLLFVLLLSVLDAWEDWRLEQGPIAFVVDAVYVAAMLAVLVYLWRLTPFALTRSHRQLTREVVARHRDVEEWRARAASLLQGLGQLIEEQFETWGLSAAEKEVGFLLLKGLSLKEIAAIRETTDRTVRQQASAIYSKAGLSGRAELSAFFLEDLLSPPPAET
ncbi:MAG: LuxR family transcriptional regulator [Acidobacteriota bacterium]